MVNVFICASSAAFCACMSENCDSSDSSRSFSMVAIGGGKIGEGGKVDGSNDEGALSDIGEEGPSGGVYATSERSEFAACDELAAKDGTRKVGILTREVGGRSLGCRSFSSVRATSVATSERSR